MTTEEVSFEEILGLAERVEGIKLYKVSQERKSIFKGDKEIKAVLDGGDSLYHWFEDFFYYLYEVSKEVFFDGDRHPYWIASFDEESFRLYDGLFLGRFGCGGWGRYLYAMGKAKESLFNSGEHDDVFIRYEEFYERFEKCLSQRDRFVADRIREQFGIEPKNGLILDGEDLVKYSSYEEEGENKENLIFWQWFRDHFIDEAEYEKKMEFITKINHREAFDRHIEGKIRRLEDIGFRRASN